MIADAPGAPPLLRAGRSPLVGRTRPLAILAEHLAEARHPEGARRPVVVLLAGPPGIGKTRLLVEFPPPDLARGVTVLRGGASEGGGGHAALPAFSRGARRIHGHGAH